MRWRLIRGGFVFVSAKNFVLRLSFLPNAPEPKPQRTEEQAERQEAAQAARRP